ncbi:TonB family protein [Mangrovibacterium sp.]|uniref:TonB family protein n=1 Tax=Mangrovibacterium sp. TaxID=1961364 RepID=UPI003567B4E8
MFDFVNYIYESGISLGLFTLLYFLFLQRETFFKTNRLFLLFALLFSALLPLFHIRIWEAQPVLLNEVTVTPYRNLLETVSVYGTELSVNIVRRISTSTYIISAYILGLCFFAFRLLHRLLQISLLIRRSDAIQEHGMKLVLIDREVTPFSFLSYVFVSKNLKEQSGWEKMLIHEFEHVKQGHSFDILILEVLSVFQWFNPFFWLLKRLLRENHEYLADRAVLVQIANPSLYKKLLLQQFIGPQVELANNFNYSLIKKRIQMMSQIKSSKLAQVKLGGGFLLAVALIVLFSLENKTFATVYTANSSDQQEQQSPSNEQSADELSNEVSTLEIIENLPVPANSKSQDTPGVAESGHILEKINPNAQEHMDTPDTLKVLVEGQELQVSGDKNAIVKFMSMVSESMSKEVSIHVKDGKKELHLSNELKAEKEDKEVTEIDGEPVFFVVETMPKFPGGVDALGQFIAKKVKYPVEAKKAKLEGKVYVTFIVDKQGKVRLARVARGVSPLLDQEALRVVNLIPDWTPGIQRGQAVAVSYTIPISFSLK